MTDEYPAPEDREQHPYDGGHTPYGTPYQAAYDGTYQPGEGDTQGAGFAPGEGVWQPLANGDFDAEATMSTRFAGSFDFQSLAPGGQPLAARAKRPTPRLVQSKIMCTASLISPSEFVHTPNLFFFNLVCINTFPFVCKKVRELDKH